MYIKYSKKDGDRKIVSTRFLTGKILRPISTMTVKWNAFHIWSSSEMYLQVEQNLLPQFAVQLHSCVPMTQRKRRKASHLFMSLPNSIYTLTLCQRGLQGPGLQDLHAWISHLSHEQEHDSASVSVDFSQAQVEKEKKKIESCIPRKRLEAIHFPHEARGKKEETFLRLKSFLGQRSHTVLFLILTRKSCLKL